MVYLQIFLKQNREWRDRHPEYICAPMFWNNLFYIHSKLFFGLTKFGVKVLKLRFVKYKKTWRVKKGDL